MKLYSFPDEAHAIAALCDDVERPHLLSLLEPHHLSMSWSNEAFVFLSQQSHAITWQDLCDSPGLSEHARMMLQEMDEPQVLHDGKLSAVVVRLVELYRLRVLYSATRSATELLSRESDTRLDDVVRVLREGFAKIGVALI